MAKSSGVYEAIHFPRRCLLDGSTLPKCTGIGSPPRRRKVQKMSVLGCLRGFFSIYFVYAASIILLQPSAEAGQLKLHTNQQMIEELLEPNDLDIKNPNAVFEAVFDALASKVVVYPTESYYYFTFPFKGIVYAGNIRFDAWDQFDGKVHFAYFPEYSYWRKPLDPVYKKLGPDDGLKITQVNKFLYKITYKGKTVDFELPDLSNVKPAPNMLRPDEVYIGPSWDESGVQFFLIFNKTAKTFLYLLNDNPKMDQYDASSLSPAVTVGIRTSFVFYKDKLVDRQILMGDFVGNTMLNNYFDGPFDQLPDNYVQGNTLLDAILEIEPGMKGEKADRYGADPTGEFRYGITSYKYYGELAELKPIVECATTNNDPAIYYKCFDATKANEEEAEGKSSTASALPWDNGKPASGDSKEAK
jgi:hypothetical protein